MYYTNFDDLYLTALLKKNIIATVTMNLNWSTIRILN